ncbi:MAG: radical SAM protein [Candidatus Omnitrophota bacterium]
MKDKIYLQWHITDACNFRCRHCYQSGFSGDSELGLADLIKVYGNIISGSEDKKIAISLTGGEPLLKKDFFDLLYYLDKQPNTDELSVISNASLIDEAALKRLNAAKKMRRVKISLDAATARTNDAIRKFGAFDMIMKKISLIKEKSDLELVLMFTVMRSNLYELPVLFQLCRDLNVDGLMIERFIPLGQSAGLRREVLDKDDWKRAVGDISEFLGISVEDCDALPCKAFWLKFRGIGSELLTAECDLGEDSFAILPGADILPCRRFALRIGNLLERDLAGIAKDSSVLKDIADRNKLKGKCGSCGIGNCRGCRALAYAISGDYLAEDIQCWI